MNAEYALKLTLRLLVGLWVVTFAGLVGFVAYAIVTDPVVLRAAGVLLGAAVVCTLVGELTIRLGQRLEI